MEQFLSSLGLHAHKKKSVTQEKNPCILSVQEQFQSESLKEFKQKDIDLQYILMCVYILRKKILLQPNTLNKSLLFCHTIKHFHLEKKEKKMY